jgi:NAD(P)-dependent dehydrogenase (short-subunit alcohol dehydrogenase family)
VGIPADVGKREEVAKLVETVKQHTDHVDFLVANAGATWGGPFETTPDWSSAKILDLNVRGIFNMVQLFQPMLEKGATHADPSRIIVVSSTAARIVPHVGENGSWLPCTNLPVSFGFDVDKSIKARLCTLQAKQPRHI